MQLITGKTPILPEPQINKYDTLWGWLADPANADQWVAIDHSEIGLPETSPRLKVSLLRHAAERHHLHVAVVNNDGLLFVRLAPPEAVAKLEALRVKRAQQRMAREGSAVVLPPSPTTPVMPAARKNDWK